MVAYDNDNIFAKILRGELPAFKIYEDDKTFAFLDIMPRCPGHALVIPKAPARNIFDISPEDFAAVARTTQKVAIAIEEGVRRRRRHACSRPTSAPAARWCSTCTCM